MLKKIFLLLTIFMLIVPAFAAEPDKKGELEQMKAIDISQADDIVTMKNDEYKDILNNITIKSLSAELMKGGWSWDIHDIVKRGFAFYMKEVYANSRLMLIIILLAILSAMLTNMQGSFQKEGISEIAFYVCYIIIIGIAVKGFSFAVESCGKLIQDLSLYIKTLVPLVMSISVAGGNFSGAIMFQPAILATTQIISIIISEILIPFLLVAVGIAIVNNMSGKMQLTKMVDLIKKGIKWSLGILLTFFVSVMTVQSMIAPVLDGAAGKSAKFALSNFVPIVGGILTESINVVVGYSLALKNVVGVAGLIITMLICFGPLVEILALITLFHLTSAVIQPICDARLSNTITEIASAMSTLFLIVMSMELVFLVNLTIAIVAGNSAAMLGR